MLWTFLATMELLSIKYSNSSKALPTSLGLMSNRYKLLLEEINFKNFEQSFNLVSFIEHFLIDLYSKIFDLSDFMLEKQCFWYILHSVLFSILSESEIKPKFGSEAKILPKKNTRAIRKTDRIIISSF
ncbi:hypothetical protein BpHYR1_048394 [Brachionus plicatilis]|uniref:Uncharacterized protein n=1 Tax=Brachionus plicatilis TaxID=10195 RepID=A0A3M7SZL5_BRAPC|nr:hypothetical protein BpHYR1_048394 [Brachionus plicatilis]